ncbi:MAG: hypothetical protein LBT74_00050 [Acidobacteriota bacterium]|jgi:hypothetical protein|nr:hypothetical protein [Acidobacteriota bacterium]
MKAIFLCIFPKASLLSVIALFVAAANASEVPLVWDPPAQPSAPFEEYRLYFDQVAPEEACDAEELQFYDPQMALLYPFYTVNGLADGAYCFAVTAANGSSESILSNILRVEIIGGIARIPYDIFCDLDEDGIIQAADVDMYAEIIVGLLMIDDSLAFDFTNDGLVNVLDLQHLNNVVLGIRSCK